MRQAFVWDVQLESGGQVVPVEFRTHWSPDKPSREAAAVAVAEAAAAQESVRTGREHGPVGATLRGAAQEPAAA